ncbi:hypothetical protein GBA52_000618 [Prunus armeniaca]|nr:hypothetical protein GBA52_000618 [Prunus armeniaca]
MGVKGFVEGGLASIVAGCSTHPLDLIKVRMQLQGESNSAAARAPQPVHNLRPAFAFNSHSATLVGPTTTAGPPARAGPISTLYSTTRMGLYEALKVQWADPNTGNLPLTRKILAGLVAGGVGAAVGNPADVAMVRMQAGGRDYKNVVDAITKMARSEGIVSLWRGSSLTVNRAMIVTASQLASYDQIKEAILDRHLMKDGLGTHVTASFAAGFVASVASNPIDVIKTRVMNMKVEPGQEPPYSGALDCALKTVRAEGPMALYKGFIPTISRQGPFTVVLFVTLEQLRKVLKDF